MKFQVMKCKVDKVLDSENMIQLVDMNDWAINYLREHEACMPLGLKRTLELSKNIDYGTNSDFQEKFFDFYRRMRKSSYYKHLSTLHRNLQLSIFCFFASKRKVDFLNWKENIRKRVRA